MTTNGNTSTRYCGGKITLCDGICKNCCKSTITYPIGFGGTSNSNSPIVLVESPYRYKIN